MPCTVQRVREACAVDADDLALEPATTTAGTAHSSTTRTRLTLERRTSW
jgi:hypothetical protein